MHPHAAVASAFIFGESLRNIFNSALFVFVTHPFDVGDRCTVDGFTNQESLFVHKINFFTTVFRYGVWGRSCASCSATPGIRTSMQLARSSTQPHTLLAAMWRPPWTLAYNERTDALT